MLGRGGSFMAVLGIALFMAVPQATASIPQPPGWPASAHRAVTVTLERYCAGRTPPRWVTVQLTVGRNGWASKVRVLDRDLKGTALEICVKKRLLTESISSRGRHGTTVTRVLTSSCAGWETPGSADWDRCRHARLRTCSEKGFVVLHAQSAAAGALRIDGRVVKPPADGKVRITSGFHGITVERKGRTAEAEFFACGGETHELSYSAAWTALETKNLGPKR